jgi:hypothetical protein
MKWIGVCFLHLDINSQSGIAGSALLYIVEAPEAGLIYLFGISIEKFGSND